MRPADAQFENLRGCGHGRKYAAIVRAAVVRAAKLRAAIPQLMLPVWTTLAACGGQRGDTDQVQKQVDDHRAPQFILQPFAENIRADGADIVFSASEKSDVALVVRAEAGLNLTHNDIASAGDKAALAVKAFETSRVPLTGLEPGQVYRVFVTLVDASGNVLSQPFLREFSTAAEFPATPLSGTPPPARQGVPWEFFPRGMPAGCTLRLADGPAWMSLRTDQAGVTGVPEWQAGQKQAQFRLALTGKDCHGEGQYEVSLSGDPLFPFAWHMNPAATGAFSWFGARPAVTSDPGTLHDAGLTGSGVHVTIIDSGMLVNHPDLRRNIERRGNINLEPLLAVGCQVCDADDTSPPLAAGERGDQGTAVAGIIAAQGWNSIGSRGIAPDAKISAYNLSAPRFPPVSEIDYLRILSLSTPVICHSASEGPKILEEQPEFSFDAWDRAQKSKVTVGRDTKGIVYIKAAGDLDKAGGNAAFDQRSTTAWTMVVGSHNILGRKSANSSTGSNLWISAAGGEAGYQSAFDELPDPKPVANFYPGLVSTDIFNDEFPCSVGYAKRPQYFQEGQDPDPKVHALGRSSGFNLGWHALNRDCRYTATVSGTSAAAAVVSGTVALMLQAAPELGWRDIRHIIARSALPIDADRAPEITEIGGSMYERTLPWITNAAGFRFHNWYGFGALNMSGAIAIIRSGNYRPLPPQTDSNWILASGQLQRIPPASIAGVFSDYFHVQDVLIETIQVRISVTHTKTGNLGIELVSPNGTRSVLKAVKDGAKFANMDEMVFLSNAFYGERAKGNWQLRVVDGRETPQAGYLNQWYFRVTGHQPGT